ncbi:MAG TPA: NADP-dependent malic enzyme [Candidatus Nanoarchaeia archaeon]|nr:NADP-dependent malic enzyme [Candidatus Nanoarchaeia archaeon]
MDIYQASLKYHKKLKGKIEIVSKAKIKTRADLSLAYTPGVAQPCREIAADHQAAYDYTIKGNAVAVVTDGSAILGLGNLGALAALPVMEGKALLFKEFAGIDAFPICLDTQEPRELTRCIRNLAPSFGGINLEDIAAPRCFIVENSLKDLGIPVFHDDQHGTAVVLYAAVSNAAKVVRKEMRTLKVVISGAGAAGTSVAKILAPYVRDVLVIDRGGILHDGRENLNEFKMELAKLTNKDQQDGQLNDAIEGADVFIGVSAPGLLKPQMIKSMAKNPIVFALANPVPEIMPKDAMKAGAAVVATGRSDFPNQVNNVLAFPGIFRGALDARAPQITEAMKMAAAKALADCVKIPTKDKILPDPLDKKVVQVIAAAVKKAAK